MSLTCLAKSRQSPFLNADKISSVLLSIIVCVIHKLVCVSVCVCACSREVATYSNPFTFDFCSHITVSLQFFIENSIRSWRKVVC